MKYAIHIRTASGRVWVWPWARYGRPSAGALAWYVGEWAADNEPVQAAAITRWGTLDVVASYSGDLTNA